MSGLPALVNRAPAVCFHSPHALLLQIRPLREGPALKHSYTHVNDRGNKLKNLHCSAKKYCWFNLKK